MNNELDAFFKDEDVLSLKRRNTVFEILSLNEHNSSKLLAWLLDPKESHGLENQFAMHLLNACAENGKVYAYTLSEDKKNKNLDLSKGDYFKNAFVYTEYRVVDCLAGPKGKKRGFIDILAIDADNDLCMVIENKYGSKEHDNQCHTYIKALKQLCRNNPKMKFVFIFLDVRETECQQEEYYNISYDDVLNFKSNLNKDSLGYRLFDSWEKDVNGIENDEKILKKLCDKYGDVLDGYNDAPKSYDVDDYFKKGNKKVLWISEYADLITKILNFKKHQNKVYEVRSDAKFTDFLKEGNLEFSQNDYERKGILTFSRPCFENENDDGRWAVYGKIYSGKDGYTFSLVYYAGNDAAMSKKLKPFLNNHKWHEKKYVVSERIDDLFRYTSEFIKDLNEAEKLFK